MQESIGGTLIFKIAMVFFIIFIFLLALAVKYSHAFVLKNNIINIIEQCEGWENDCAQGQKEKLYNEYLKATSGNLEPEVTSSDWTYYTNAGLWGKTYYVTTKINFQLPFVESFVIGIKGQTKTIFDMSDSKDHSN